MTPQEFEAQYSRILRQLLAARVDDEALRALSLAETDRESSGSDEYNPEWLEPFVAIAARVMAHAALDVTDPRTLASALSPLVQRAVQLGYTEGFFAAKDD